ncbi:MAG TPA: hypothetical protein VFQ45_17665 [Longimicrobium sp.]|nr:hypothetical protein [Longimicrobium sp.]
MPRRAPSPSTRIAAVLLLAAAASACRDQLPDAEIPPGTAPAASGAAGSLQYFGYVGNGDDDWGLAMTKGFTNFAHVATRNSTTDPFVRDRVTAIAQRGLKATIDLGRIFWCDYVGDDSFRFRCNDWEARWAQWKAFNAGILTPDKVLAFAVLDEPFNRNVNMAHYEELVLRVKADFPWAKTWMFEGACIVMNEWCGYAPGSNAFARYTGTLPGVDWIGIDQYIIHPATNSTFQNARSRMKARFPGKQWAYVMDGWWTPGHAATFGARESMRAIAREWYDVARADPSAVLLGVFFWPGSQGSLESPCSVLLEHVAIGRAITGKARVNSAQPVGRLQGVYPSTGGAGATVFGYAADPDGTVCENPRVDLYGDGQYLGGGTFPANAAPGYTAYYYTGAGGTGVAWQFRANLPAGVSGMRITAVARDLDAGSVTLPSNCAESPACVWYSQFSEPKGYMDGISVTGVASGWVCDPDAPQVSSKVRLALDDGSTIGTYTTNLGSEQAVADECGGGYTHRFQVQLPASTRGRLITAYAQDLVAGEVQIPWIWPCEWFCSW